MFIIRYYYIYIYTTGNKNSNDYISSDCYALRMEPHYDQQRCNTKRFMTIDTYLTKRNITFLFSSFYPHKVNLMSDSGMDVFSPLFSRPTLNYFQFPPSPFSAFIQPLIIHQILLETDQKYTEELPDFILESQANFREEVAFALSLEE